MELTGKQKRFLRSLANTFKPIVAIGKEGINEGVLIDINNYITKHELMKVHVLQNCMETLDEVAFALEEEGYTIVQKIGSTLLLYRPNPKLKDGIILP